ncbi:MAG: vitamin K epoxide reductase family protein [bacterium]|nr:vitamin K epoxide reductase family protein [bacterium]
MLAASFIGFLDASYLTAAHYFNFSLPCSILSGCDLVITSEYSKILGIPVALLGAIYYSFIFFASIAYLDAGNSFIIKLVAYATILGFLASLWFVYVQLFILNALCLYCIISAITSTALFILGMRFLAEKRITVV